MTRCLLVQPIDASGVAVLQAAGIEVLAAPDTGHKVLAPLLADADVAITRNWGFPSAALALAPRLKVIGVHGTGMDRVDLAGARARGITVVNTPGANAPDVAELALGLMLAAARQLVAADASVRSGDGGWRQRNRGLGLGGRCLGLWGWGHVSRALVPMARGLGMRVLVLSAHADPAELAALGAERAVDAADLLAQADVLSLHGVPGPRPVIGAVELAALRPGAILVNTARGALIDEQALALALHSGHLGAAALDVTRDEPLPMDSPLLTCPNLTLAPHVGGNTGRALAVTAQAVARAVLEALGR
ncbi:NAD(P)-dependent oxidoreductase [Gemmobacter nectariphilus]|uniref:NAD(P)-dependent oxidoreductase n=1 Tax=Gemmobacter nectariphilus TaxID=220343 RepID=UPI0003F76CEB|nr:NAD(P)-dependent oxidoreductase [Gemmobacter nectariphilus]